MVSVRQDVMGRHELEEPSAASVLSRDNRTAVAVEPSTPRAAHHQEPDAGRSRHLISLRISLPLLFAVAAVVPTLVLLGLGSAGLADAIPSLPRSGGLVLLVVIVSTGFGVALGLIVTRQLAGPLAALTAVVDSFGHQRAPLALPASEIREIARLSNALATLRSRVIVQYEADESESRERLASRWKTEVQYEVAARGPNDGLWDWDLMTDTLYCSPRWHALAGVSDGGDLVPPTFWFDRVHPDDLPKLRAAIDAHLQGQVDHLACEARLRGHDDVYRWTLCRGLALRREDGTAYRIAGSLTEIADRRDADERRLHDAHLDPLTGQANRAHFLDRLGLAVRRAQRTGAYRLAVLLLDVDRFKLVNDSLGRALGDELLLAIARRLEASVRDEDMIARLGGDEWAILVDDLATDDEASNVAERVHEVLRQPLLLGEQSFFATVSIGIAITRDGASAPEDLLRDAEAAMYRAKELGRDRHVVFDTSLHGRAIALLALESDLRYALEHGELVVYYQPIVRADDLAVRGVEALVRWRHAERGLVPPADFIGFAEESGLILPLGEWVLQRAIEQMREWQAAGVAPERISVNLSARQLRQDRLAERVALLLERAGLDARCLELELTEGVVAEQDELTIAALRCLRALGVRIAVDDFGTGYSSLAYLTRFPVSTVKIDRTFLVDIQDDTVNQAIVQAVTTLAHSIDMRVVAEGIETREQHELARSLGCDEVQGFLVSVPLSADDMTVWLGAQRGPDAMRKAVQALERAETVPGG